MKNFLTKQREVVALLSYAAIIASLVYFVILPLIASINSINDQIQQETMKQESVRLHLEQLPRIQKQYQALQNEGDLANALLDKNKAVVLIEKIEKLAESTGNKVAITVQDAAPTTVTKKNSTKSTEQATDTLLAKLPSQDYLQMKINLTGDYASVITFIDLLEKFEYYADITEVKINKDEADEAPSSTTSNRGLFDVAPQSAVSSSEARKNVANDDVLAASLTTVFYIN